MVPAPLPFDFAYWASLRYAEPLGADSNLEPYRPRRGASRDRRPDGDPNHHKSYGYRPTPEFSEIAQSLLAADPSWRPILLGGRSFLAE